MENILRLAVIMLVLIGSFSSCSEDAITNATGTVIGSYSNGWVELLVQVDKKYPIGEKMKYVGSPGDCMQLSKDGIYLNMIGIQPDLPLFNFPENETIINKRILFSFRPFNEEEDIGMFVSGRLGNAYCIPPDVPLYVITECRIIK